MVEETDMSTKEIELPRGDTFDSQMRRYTFSEGQVHDILTIYTQAQQDEIDRLKAIIDDHCGCLGGY